MQKFGMKDVYRQLALDYCCDAEDIKNAKSNIFTEYKLLDGQRAYDGREGVFLKIAAVHNKILCTGREDIIKVLKERYENVDGAWFLEAVFMHKLNEIIKPYGHLIKKIHPFFVAFDQTDVDDNGYTLKLYEREDIEAFRGDKRFSKAFTFVPEAPDELGVGALENGEILAMAGASGDSPMFWQIGINVLPEARGKHLGALTVSKLKNEILKRGRIPYYGTAFSHTLSLNIAVESGFRPAWTELLTMKLSDGPAI